MAKAHAAVIPEFGLLLLPVKHDQHRKNAHAHQRVSTQIEQHTGHARGVGRYQAHQQVPAVRHAGIGQQALDVALIQGQKIAAHHGERGQSPQQRLPLALQRLEAREENAHEDHKTSGPGTGGQKCRHRNGRSLVHIRRPRVERHHCHLEAETDQ